VSVSLVVDVVSGTLLVVGVLLSLVASLGVLRFPDLFSRMHAATKPATLGLLLVLCGAALQMIDPGDIVELALVAAFQLITAPVAAHMIGRAAYRSGITLSSEHELDELAEAVEREAAERAERAGQA
jgi:multicomponent Na+:H+ antiporter subunit G